MNVPTSMEIKLLPVAKFVVQDDAASAPKEYSCVLDFNAVVRCEKATGLDISQFEAWQKLSFENLVTIAWSGFHRFHPEVTLEQVQLWLGPTDRGELWLMLMNQVFPEWVKLVLSQKGLTEQTPGKDAPNA